MDEKFEDWLGGCEYLVQDFEGSLRSQPALDAFKRVGVKLVEEYPRCSQDFNAIENAWDLLRRRLDETLPKKLETRQEFVERLLAAVKWLNKYRKQRLEELSRNQKTRCAECVKLGGARTSWLHSAHSSRPDHQSQLLLCTSTVGAPTMGARGDSAQLLRAFL